MRSPRQRRYKRSQRLHPKQTYILAAVKIQRVFRKYLDRRFKSLCVNYEDDECIMLQPVSRIPRSLLIVMDKVAFDCRYLLIWLKRSNVHPLSRAELPKGIRKKCLKKVKMFLKYQQNKCPKKGFYSRRRALKQTMDRYV